MSYDFYERHRHATCVGFVYVMRQAYFVDEETETRAMLCRGRDRLVLAFRGTARLNNVLTDLKLHQASRLVFSRPFTLCAL